MINTDEVLKIGYLQKSHGIKGEITLIFDKSDYADIDTDFYFLDIDGIYVPFFIEEITFVTHIGARVKFEDINDETQASRYVNLSVFVYRSQAIENKSDENDDWDFFIGYSVSEQNGRSLGIIESVDSSTMNVLFLLKDAEKEYLIPATQDFISEIDEHTKHIRMNLPEGLIE